MIGVGSRGGRINQSQCTFPRIVIGLFFCPLLPTPTNWFSLDHKRNVSDGVVSGMETLFSVDYKLYASDYDSDSDSDSVARWKPAFIKFSVNHNNKIYRKNETYWIGFRIHSFVLGLQQQWCATQEKNLISLLFCKDKVYNQRRCLVRKYAVKTLSSRTTKSSPHTD